MCWNDVIYLHIFCTDFTYHRRWVSGGEKGALKYQMSTVPTAAMHSWVAWGGLYLRATTSTSPGRGRRGPPGTGSGSPRATRTTPWQWPVTIKVFFCFTENVKQEQHRQRTDECSLHRTNSWRSKNALKIVVMIICSLWSQCFVTKSWNIHIWKKKSQWSGAASIGWYMKLQRPTKDIRPLTTWKRAPLYRKL